MRYGPIQYFAEDTMTRTKVEVEDKVIRQLLTDACPLPKNRRILWHAITGSPRGSIETRVYYPWTEAPPKAKPE